LELSAAYEREKNASPTSCSGRFLLAPPEGPSWKLIATLYEAAIRTKPMLAGIFFDAFED